MKLFYLPISIFGVFWLLLTSASASGGPTSQPATIVFPINDPNHLLVIPLILDGKTAYFLFDTGTTISILDSHAFPLLRPTGPVESMDSPGGSVSMQPFEPPKLSIGPWNLADSGPVYRMDLSSSRTLNDMPIVGILGVNIWRGWIVQMDFDAHELRFFRPDNRPHSEWGTSIPIEDHDADGNDFGLPAIRLTIGDFEGLFTIDSGAESSGLPSGYGFDRVLGATTRPAISIPITTAAGLKTQRLLRSPSFQIGGLRYGGLLFGETVGWRGILGLDFLSRHLVTLDWPNHRLYLKAGKKFGRYDVIAMSGLSFERRGLKTLVYAAMPNEPGYQAGLRVGDELLEINGKPASNYSLYDLETLFVSKDELKITVKFQRDKIVRTVSFSVPKEF